MLQSLFLGVTKVTLTTSVVIVAVLILLPLLHKKYTVKWRYWLWLIIAIRLLVPFSLSLPQSPIKITPPAQNIEFRAPLSNTVSTLPERGKTVPQINKAESPAASTITLNEILSVVWAVGIAVFMLYHLIGYYLFRKSILRFSRLLKAGPTCEIWHELLEERKISRNIQLLVCKKIHSPLMTGFFRPLLLLPDRDYSDTDLKIILQHELIHYQRGDIWYKLILVCANAMHWFNPLIYYLRLVADKDLEMACDFELVKDADISFRKQYSETILLAIRKGKERQTVFSTYFYGGKQTMKERLANILDMSKKRQGIVTLCAVVLIMGITGSTLAYSVSDGTAKVIDNVALLSAGNWYGLVDGEFIISYGAEKSAVVPLTPDTDDQAAYFAGKAVYIAEEVTAVAYGDKDNPAAPVTVLISNDQGQTWHNYTVPDTKSEDYGEKYIGFTTPNDGWLFLAGGVAMGHQENRIFTTSDGGKNWREIGNTNDVYARVVTGAGFANSSIGLVSFRYDSDPNPVVFRTTNRGRTWTKCSLAIPDSFKSITSYATALSPVFHGAQGVLPVTFRNNNFDSSGDPVDVTVWYETKDYGKTWTFNEKYNLALIWADAWSTRNGKARYEIMNSQMQAEFRTQQCSPDDPNVIYYAIRWSSPWVVSYNVTLDGAEAVVTYLYTDSTTSTYKGVERLTFGEENGRTVVTDCQTEVDMEEYVDTSDWQPVDTGLYTFNLPKAWQAQVFDDGTFANGMVEFTINGTKIGTLERLGYYPSQPFSQFEGNHAQTLRTATITGCQYPATEVIIRRTQPAAAQDDSYMDELHIYLIPQDNMINNDLGFAYDLCFDCSRVNEKKATAIARSFVVDTNCVALYEQILNLGCQWGEAVQNRDGRAQYNLMSSKLQQQVYADYQQNYWVTGQSSPWVDSYGVKPGDNTAVVTYVYMTSDGFAGYYQQTLSFTKENGQLVISGVTEPKQPNGQEEGVVISYLEDQKTYLSADSVKNGMFSSMTLSINGRTKRFSWETYSGMAFLPELSYVDVDSNGQNELVIILCEGEGTGALTEEIHVINPEDFSEIAVQDPLAALEERVVSKIGDDGVKITIDDKNTLTFSAEEELEWLGERANWFKNLEMGSIVDYSVEGSYITVNIGAQISPASFLGAYHLIYNYEDNQLKINSISFSQDA